MQTRRICPYCSSTGKDPFLRDVCQVCKGDGEVETYTGERQCPVCGGTGRDPYERAPCRKCKGFGAIHRGPLLLFYIGGERPYSDRRTVESILEELTGNVLICETYLGKETLDLLRSIPAECTVRVLMGVHKGISSGDFQRFTKERPKFEFRQAQRGELHDRYVVDERGLMILGHGFKDLGKKESFAIFIEKPLMIDNFQTISQAFDGRWQSATPVP